MGYQINRKSRRELKNKMATVFSENIKTLSTDLQGVLLDDLVTALENRLNVLKQDKSKHAICDGNYRMC